MTLNESIVETAAPSWFADLGYTIGHGPRLGIPSLTQANRSFHLPNSALLRPEVSARLPNPF